MSEQHCDQWINYTGPAHWYSLSYPQNWIKDESEGILQLSTPDGSSTLTISCHWQSLLPQSNFDSDLKIDFDQFFVKHRKIQKRGPLAIKHNSIGYSGEAVIQQNSSWWRELAAWFPLAKKHWHHWNLWLIRERAIQMVVTFFYDPKDHAQIFETVQKILHSVELSLNPANPPDLFANEVLQLAQKKFPLAPAQLLPGFRLKFAESEINLTNFYRAYLTTPEHFEKTITTSLATILQINEWGSDQTEPDLVEIRERIMPILLSKESWEQNFPNFVGENWIADLAILYVVDESNAYWYIHEKLLDK